MSVRPTDPNGDLPARRRGLRERLGNRIARGAVAPWAEEEFAELALEVFRYQAAANPVYGAFVRGRGLDPESMEDWREIPPVPTRAFKELPLVCEDPAPIEATFRTSGTTRGTETRGEHRVRDLSLYRTSLLSAAAAFLRPELEHPDPPALRVLALLPEPAARPDSSLVHMAGVILDAWDDGEGGFYADAEWSLDLDAFAGALDAATAARTPVLLMGTAFGFVHWLDQAGDRSVAPLPEGSRLMETGGFKGRSRAVGRGELYRALSERLGVAPERIVNEYGMTELLSQFYEPVLREGGPADPGARRHLGPPWVRTRVLDPVDLSPLPPGATGLLCHLDLANLDSVAAVLTEDAGVEREDGFRVLGRMAGAEPRGCSLTMEALLHSGAPEG